MNEDNQVVQKVRAAIGDRALYLALIYRSFSRLLPPDQLESATRAAIHEFGRQKGIADQKAMTPDAWVDQHVSGGGAVLFNSNIVKSETQDEQQMTYCPLMAAWKEMGCSDEEMDLLCDIAMEVDRGRADYHGIPYEIQERMAKGDPFCRLILKKTA